MGRKPRRRLTPTAFLVQSGPGKTTKVYEDGKVIYAQGSPGDVVFCLLSGTVLLTVVSKHRRRRAVLAVLQKGDFFGEGCLGNQASRTSTATALGPCVIAGVEKGIFRRKLYRDPVFAAMFIDGLLSQAARLKADLADHFFNFSERRLARILLESGRVAGKATSGMSLPISQSKLAEMVGTTRPRISFFMNRFRKKGYVRYNGALEIDSARLMAFLKY